MSKPSIILVPGSYCLLSGYKPIFEAVSKAGYEILGVHLPTIGPSSGQGRDEPAPPMYEDAAVIAREVEKLADEGKDVILVGHSYAGVPMSQSTKGLGKREREDQGKPGGIVQLAYIACLVPPIGGSAGSLLGRFPDNERPALSIDEHGWMSTEDPAGTAAMICQDLPPEEGEAIVRKFAKHSAQSFGNELTYAGYKEIPASYLLAEKDLAGPPEFQRDMIAVIEQVSGRKVDVTNIASGHMAHLSAETETIEWILNVADKLHKSQEDA